MKIMAQSFRLRPVNHADRALQPWTAQSVRHSAPIAQVDPKSVKPGLVKQLFVTPAQRRAHILPFGVCAPIRSCRHAAMISTKSNQDRFFSKSLTNQLTNVVLAMLAHFRRARVSQVGIVRPHDHLGGRTSQMFHQFFEHLHHMLVPQIPRLIPARKH